MAMSSAEHPSTVSAPTPTLKVEVFPSSTLLHPSQKQILRNICRLINDSFSAHGHPKDNGDTVPGSLFLRKRLIQDEELPTELGVDGLTAICADERSTGSTLNGDETAGPKQVGEHGRIVATASVKLWKGKVVDLARSIQNTAKVNTETQTQTQTQTSTGISDQDLALAEQTLRSSTTTTDPSNPNISGNWEIKLCASLDDPSYRHQGLMTKCIDALIRELKARRISASGSSTSDTSSKSTNNNASPLNLWITSLEGTGNTEYWVRRGYERVGEAEGPPLGTWESTREIRICTLMKVVE